MRQLTAMTICLLGTASEALVAQQQVKVAEAFYQEVDVQRRPQFRMQDLTVDQNIHYRIQSYFRLYEPNPKGMHMATQEIREAELIEADHLSQSIPEYASGFPFGGPLKQSCLVAKSMWV